jgi:hypothetical protein
LSVPSIEFKRGAKGDFKREPGELSQLVAERMSGHDGAVRFVRFRFHRPLAYSITWSFRYGYASSLLSVGVIAFGLASSALAAAGDSNDTVIAAFGLVIAVVAAINRLWRPGLRAVARHQTANALRREGWAFVLGRGAYENLPDATARSEFQDAVERINAAVEAIDESQAETEDQRAA